MVVSIQKRHCFNRPQRELLEGGFLFIYFGSKPLENRGHAQLLAVGISILTGSVPRLDFLFVWRTLQKMLNRASNPTREQSSASRIRSRLTNRFARAPAVGISFLTGTVHLSDLTSPSRWSGSLR
jgi:hypothetical protein